MRKGVTRFSPGRLLAMARVFDVAVTDLFDGYGSGAPLGPPLDRSTTQMLVHLTNSFLKLEPKHQEALMRLVRGLAAEGLIAVLVQSEGARQSTNDKGLSSGAVCRCRENMAGRGVCHVQLDGSCSLDDQKGETPYDTH
jgi:hypothetical protein